MHIQLQRVYETNRAGQARRVLVDRLWPRGLAKADAAVDLWLREVAPSTELRRWFAHDAAKWEQFKRRYTAELDERPALIGELLALASEGDLVLLYAARDGEHNNAVVLREYLLARESADAK
jgi:uncharacterized protein YeaO (DUF488 family)